MDPASLPDAHRTTVGAAQRRPAGPHGLASIDVDALELFDLVPTEDPHRWRLPVVRGVCSGMGALFGGAALGAAVEVLERVTGRPLVWATVQYLAFARPPDVVELEALEVTRGHQSSQARVFARVDGREIFTVLAALGRRELAWSGSWAIRPLQ